MQLLCCSQARHFCRKIMAVPVLAQILSLGETKRMASVGQTSPQRQQWGSQGPRRGVRAGLNRPGQPAVSQMGCRVLVGQTAEHSPQRTHRAKNSISGRDPGGRSSPGGATRPGPGLPYGLFRPVRPTTAVPAPASPATRKPRRPGEKSALDRGLLLTVVEARSPKFNYSEPRPITPQTLGPGGGTERERDGLMEARPLGLRLDCLVGIIFHL